MLIRSISVADRLENILGEICCDSSLAGTYVATGILLFCLSLIKDTRVSIYNDFTELTSLMLFSGFCSSKAPISIACWNQFMKSLLTSGVVTEIRISSSSFRNFHQISRSSGVNDSTVAIVKIELSYLPS